MLGLWTTQASCDLYTLTYYTLTTELQLPETFIITLSVNKVTEMQVILWLKFTPCCTINEACVGLMRHVNTTL